MPSLAAMLHTTGIATPLSYVGRVGLDRFYNLRSPRTRVAEISTCRELLRRLCVFGDCTLHRQARACDALALLDHMTDIVNFIAILIHIHKRLLTTLLRNIIYLNINK